MNVETSKLFYTKVGTGKKDLLLFHGFGQDHSVFISLIQSLSEQYTCYLFDLYFHGKSEWIDNERPLEKKEWKECLSLILNENKVESFSLLGYSLGAKFVLVTLESFPDKVNEIFLVAPDGIKTSTWYSLATYPIALRKIFKSMIQRPERFHALARTLTSLGLLDKGIIRFAEQQMNTIEKRKRVYYSWVVFRHLKFNMKEVGSLIDQFRIQLVIVVGKYDKVIKPENMNPLLKHCGQHRLEIMETGHNGLLEKGLATYLLKAE